MVTQEARDEQQKQNWDEVGALFPMKFILI